MTPRDKWSRTDSWVRSGWKRWTRLSLLFFFFFYSSLSLSLFQQLERKKREEKYDEGGLKPTTLERLSFGDRYWRGFSNHLREKGREWLFWEGKKERKGKRTSLTSGGLVLKTGTENFLLKSFSRLFFSTISLSFFFLFCFSLFFFSLLSSSFPLSKIEGREISDWSSMV